MSSARDWWGAITATVNDVAAVAADVWKDVAEVVAPTGDAPSGAVRVRE